MANLSITLSSFQLNVEGFGLLDASAEPLLTADNLNVQVLSKKMFSCNIIATGVVIHADINPVDWQDGNWSDHLSQIRREIGYDSKMRGQPAADEGKGEWEVPVSKGTMSLSIAAKQASIRIKQPPITLPLAPLVISSTDLSPNSAIHDLVHGILGKAARDAGSNSFRREIRKAARRAARGVAAIAVDRLFANAGKRIGEWCIKVDQAQNFLVDIPDVDDAQRTMNNVHDVLQKLEGLLPSAERKDTRLRDGEGPNAFRSRMRELDEGDAKD